MTLTDAEIKELREECAHWEQSAAPLESYDVERVYAALPRLLDEVERSRALLRRIEWSARGGQDGDPACPECGALGDRASDHENDCELAALIYPRGAGGEHDPQKP